ncbi:MAG: putative benzoate 1,2-dioxygenase, subunit beta [Ramlibacter sp.]|nr:putative benzoate 1,2-dioxygenase, subunit beta [Ramlibacter sp.]
MNMDAAILAELSDLVYLEARLLDDADYEPWLALFAEGGRYWVPLKGRLQAEDETHNSIADEDHLLRAMRVERLRSPRAHSQQPPSQCQHVLQAPSLVEGGADRWLLRTAFTYSECRGESSVTLHGHCLHRIVRSDGRLRIALKRVNLLNAHARLPAVQLFI